MLISKAGAPVGVWADVDGSVEVMGCVCVDPPVAGRTAAGDGEAETCAGLVAGAGDVGFCKIVTVGADEGGEETVLGDKPQAVKTSVSTSIDN